MDKFNLLDCTLRDGGYINDWKFTDEAITEMIKNMIEAGLDFIEVGYLNRSVNGYHTTQFHSIEQIAHYIPANRRNSMLIAMIDVRQFSEKDLTPITNKSIDGIRVVFYKHQIEEAMILATSVQRMGYKLFMQPMVTIDYSIDEYAMLTEKIAMLEPYAVSIVDSFGYMLKEDFRQYFKILDNILQPEVAIGFHSHNNMDLAFITAQDVLEYNTMRRIIIDASLYGMGRGAGNLNTELIANYYNMTLGKKYDIGCMLDLIGKYIMPIHEKRSWGYSPYLFITGLYHYHPNFACYLLEKFDVTVSEFERFIHTIPESMKTNCKRQYVMDMWIKFQDGGALDGKNSCSNAY